MSGSSVVRLDTATCERVHEASLKVLAETGVDVKHEEARNMLAAAGAAVDGLRVRMGAEMVDAALASVARTSVVKARGADGAIVLEDGNTYFGTGSDCLYFRDPDDGARRRVRNADVETMAALCERLPNMDFVMSMGLPEDIPSVIDDLAPFAAMLAGTRKPLLVATRSGAYYSIMEEMAGICGESQSFAIYGMPAPPLAHGYEAVEKVMECARHNIPIIYGPAPVAGATGPCSVIGVALTSNIEVLSGLVIHQLAAPGAPFVYGSNQYGIDFRTGTATYVCPESYVGQFLGCDLARHYSLPSWGYAACSDSKLLDQQWSAEAAFTALLGALAGATLLHDVGYLEAGLQSSCESIVLGDDIAGFCRAIIRDYASDEEELALAVDEITTVGPGGDFLARPLTRKRSHEWWHSGLLDQVVFDRWEARGSSTLSQRVRDRVATVRAQDGFVLDGSIRQQLDKMVQSQLKQ